MTRLHRKAADFMGGQPFYWREAALCAPAMPLILLIGVYSGQLAYGAAAAGAAFCVGFGAARDLTGRRWAAMICAMLGTSLTAILGCLAGQSLWVEAPLAALAAIGCATLALYDEDLWWVALQMVIALLVAGYYAGPPHAALTRGAVVFAGGLLQTVVVIGLARLFPTAAQRLPPPVKAPAPTRKLVIGHAVRAAACVSIALLVAVRLGLANSYWAPMTAMIVLKPGLSETNTRGLARLLGTIAGCAVASLYAWLTHGAWPLLVAGLTVTAVAAFAGQKAHYAILTGCITATMVLLVSLARGDAALTTAWHRLAATVLGGAIALAVARIAPHQPAHVHPGADRVGGRKLSP